MPDSIAAVAARIEELDARLERLALAPQTGWPPSLAVIDPTVPAGRRSWPAVAPVPSGAVGPGWTAAFATILRDVSGSSGPSSTAPSAVGAAAEPAVGGGPVVEPVPGGRITQRFTLGREETGAGHDGLDVAAPLGTTVRAIAPGLVRFAGRHPDGAVVVRVEHADGSQSWYAHLDPALAVEVGDRVVAGQPLGQVGLTGRTTGPHLHLEIWYGGRPVDPEPILRSGILPGVLETRADPAAALRRFDAVASRIPYAAEIRAAAVRAGIDPLLLAALVRTESGFRPDAVSRAGAMGLSQLMPATARSLGIADPFDPAANLDGGARYLAGNLRMFGRVDLALAAYQAGKGAVRRAGGVPESPVTRTYVARVLETWADYLASAEGAT